MNHFNTISRGGFKYKIATIPFLHIHIINMKCFVIFWQVILHWKNHKVLECLEAILRVLRLLLDMGVYEPPIK